VDLSRTKTTLFGAMDAISMVLAESGLPCGGREVNDAEQGGDICSKTGCIYHQRTQERMREAFLSRRSPFCENNLIYEQLHFPLKRSSTLDTNFGVWPFTICRRPGPNSWKTLIPASLPTVEPKLLTLARVVRREFRLEAEWAATDASNPRKYVVFSLSFPEPSCVTKMRDAA